MAYFNAPSRLERDSPINYRIKHFTGTCCYVPILLFFLYAASFEFTYIADKDSPAYETIQLLRNYRYCYFSVWNFVLQMVFMIVCIIDNVANIWEVNWDLQNRIYKYRCYLYNGAVFPFTILIMIAFWGLYFIDRRLLFPDEVFQALPNWLNHTLHTAILMPIIIEFLLPRAYLDIDVGPCLVFTFLIYGLQAILCRSFYEIRGKWLYPLFDQTSIETTNTLCFVGLVASITLTFIGVHIHNTKIPIYRRQRRGRRQALD